VKILEEAGVNEQILKQIRMKNDYLLVKSRENSPQIFILKEHPLVDSILHNFTDMYNFNQSFNRTPNQISNQTFDLTFNRTSNQTFNRTFNPASNQTFNQTNDNHSDSFVHESCII
jgi:hypothetical protein